MEVQTSERAELLALIRNKPGVIKHDSVYGFELSSGKVSSYYFDLRKVTEDPRGINIVASQFLRKLESMDVRASKVGGLESGSIPITTAMVQKSLEFGMPLEGFWVRKKPKRYADKAMVAGNLKSGDRVLIVDDAFTTGTSLIKAARVVKKHGADVVAAFSIINRAAEPTFEILGIPYHYIFSEREVLDGLVRK